MPLQPTFISPQLPADAELNLPNDPKRKLEVGQTRTLTQIQSTAGLGAAALAGVPLSIADTFLSSFGLVEDDTVENLTEQLFGSIGTAINESRENGAQAVGDVVGLLIPGTLGAKAVRSKGWVSQLAQKLTGNPNARRFFSTGLTNEQLFERHFQRARLLAENKVNNLELIPGFQNAKRRALKRSVQDVLVESVGADAAIALSMNSSEFLFPSEFSVADHLGMFAGTTGAVGLGAAMIARRTFRLGVNAAVTGTLGNAINPNAIPLSEAALNVQGERGGFISTRAMLLSDTNKDLAEARAVNNKTAIDSNMRIQTALREQMQEGIVRAFQDSPIDGVTRSIAMKNDAGPFTNTVQAALETDPGALLNMRSLETFETGARDGFERRLRTKLETDRVNFTETQREIDELLAITSARTDGGSKPQQNKLRRLRNKSMKLQAEIDDLEGTTAQIIELDGTTSALANRAPIFQDGPRTLNRAEGVTSVKFATIVDEPGEIFADGSGNILVGPPRENLDFDIGDDLFSFTTDSAARQMDDGVWADLNHEQQTAVWDLLNDRLTRLNVDTMSTVTVSDTTHFTQLDFLHKAVLGANGKDVAQNIRGYVSPEDLQFRSLKGKFREFQNMRDEAMRAQMKGKTHPMQNLDNVARALNLPKDGHPILHFFEKSRIDGVVELDTLVKNLDEFSEGVRKFAEIPDGVEINKMDFTGRMLEMPFNRKPVLAVVRNTDNAAGLNTGDMAGNLLARRAEVGRRLRSAKGTRMVTAIMDDIDKNAGAVAAAKREIHNLIQGNEANSFLTRGFVQQNFRFRDDPAFRALDFITDLSDKARDNTIERILNPQRFGLQGKNHQATFNKLLNRGNEGSLNQVMIARNAVNAGWDVAKDFLKETTNSNGQKVFNIALDGKSERNRELWERMFPGERFPDAETVLMPVTGKRASVALDEIAADALMSLNELSQQLLRETNALQYARNQSLTARKRLHLPPIDLSKKETAFLVDKTGKVRTVIGADTETELRRLVEQERRLAGEGTGVVFKDTVERFAAARSEAFFEMTDFSRPSRQTGAATGASATQTIDTGPKAFQNMLEQVLRQYHDVGRETRMLLFEPEIQHLRLQKAMAGTSKRTIFDEAITRIAGVQNIDTDTFIGKALTSTEELYDKMLQNFWDAKIAKTLGLAARRDARESGRAKRRFEALEESLGPEHNPFKNFTDFVESTNELKLPRHLRRDANMLNEITTALTIRIFDAGMGVINVASLAATLPAVANMTRRLDGETDEQWLSRIGVFSTVTDNGNAWFSPTKAVTSGVHFMFSKEGREVAKRARNLGFFDQFAAEQIEIFGRTGETFTTGLIRDFTNKASFITDTTEVFARKMSWMTFYNMGKNGMGLDDHAAMAFAHRQANRTIADFRPANRPAIFQGAAGMPLGLFTTYMWNYTQRLAEMVETIGVGGGKRLAHQGFLQATLFGAESLPGWDMYTNLFMDNYDGSSNVVDRFNEAFGSQAADVLLNGTLANLPKLFGASDGISISPRASVGLPFERGIGPSQVIPGLQLAIRAGTTIGKVVDSTIAGGVDPVRVAEILAAANINKGMSNMIELAVTNTSLDHTGSVIDPSVELGLNIDTMARALGFKPLATDELRQENVRNRNTERVQQELKARLADTLRSKIRGGRLTAEDFDSSVESYMRAGGSPDGFRRFFNSQVIRGATSKVDLEIVRAMQGSIDENRLGRLLYLEPRITVPE